MKTPVAFSLVELLVVLVIVAIIAAIAVPAIEGLFDEKEPLRQEARTVGDLLHEARNQAVAEKRMLWLEVDSDNRLVSILRDSPFYSYNFGQLAAEAAQDTEKKDDGKDSESAKELKDVKENKAAREAKKQTPTDDSGIVKSVFCPLSTGIEGFYADLKPRGQDDDTGKALREEQLKRQQALRDVTVSAGEGKFQFYFNRFGGAGAAGVRLSAEFGSFDVITDFLTGKPEVHFNAEISRKGDR